MMLRITRWVDEHLLEDMERRIRAFEDAAGCPCIKSGGHHRIDRQSSDIRAFRFIAYCGAAWLAEVTIFRGSLLQAADPLGAP